jgi:predicted RNase H-like nuclease (RuvC/YqgF family)
MDLRRIDKMKSVKETLKMKNDRDIELESREGRILMLEDALRDKENEIMALKARTQGSMASVKQTLHPGDQDHLRKVAMDQKRRIDEFRGSIVYPLYVFTHAFGKTGIGNIIERMVKGKF